MKLRMRFPESTRELKVCLKMQKVQEKPLLMMGQDSSRELQRKLRMQWMEATRELALPLGFLKDDAVLAIPEGRGGWDRAPVSQEKVLDAPMALLMLMLRPMALRWR